MVNCEMCALGHALEWSTFHKSLVTIIPKYIIKIILRFIFVLL